MDLEFELQYKRLMVHHLEKHEIEHELRIRAVQFDPIESRSAIQRRLRDRLKEEKELSAIDVDFLRCKVSVDEEIKVIDSNVEQIRSYLENEKRFEGFKDSLKTRLVHYFARVRRAQEYAETDEDLNDFDKLLCGIRGLMNTHFSIFSPMHEVREEMLAEISRSVSNLRLGAIPKDNQSKKGTKSSKKYSRGVEDNQTEKSEGEVSEAAGFTGSSSRRELKSIKSKSTKDLGALAAWYPFAYPPYSTGGRHPEDIPDSCSSERMIRRIPLGRKSKPAIQAETSDSVSSAEESRKSSSSSDSPVGRNKNYRRHVKYKGRPVSDWGILPIMTM
nr:uncharacterized protein LOC115267700 [Aedes albopictus]